MSSEETPGRDRKQITIIVLAVVAIVLVGLIIGFVVSGGLSPGPTATTLAPSTTVPATTPSTAPPTTGVPGQLSVPAIEDTYVNSEEPQDVNGSEAALEIENDPPEVKQALVRFEVPAIPEGETIRAVTLRLFVLEDTDATIAIHEVEGEWSQVDASAANAPALGAQVATIVPAVPPGSTVDVDLTGVVTGPGQYDFYLSMTEDDGAEFASIESGSSPPTLVIEWGTESAGATNPVTELSGDSVVVAGAGDIADCAEEGDTATAELLGQVVEAHDETIVFTTGDNAYPSGAPEDFADCYEPTWGGNKDRTRPTPGNHEYDTPDATGYFGYFGDAAGSPDEGYYSYEAGDWQVVALNSNCEEIGGCQEGSPQEEWLREELAGSDAACTMAYWHHPLFSSSGRGGLAEVRPLFRALYEDGAELILTGHDHNYERFAPQDPDGIHDPVSGIREFVVGTGGKGNPGFDEIAANSEARYGDSFGILKLDLYTDGYEWEFITELGSTFSDVGIEACH